MARSAVRTAAGIGLAAGCLATSAIFTGPSANATTGATSSHPYGSHGHGGVRGPVVPNPHQLSTNRCTPSGFLVGYSDALDKQVYNGAQIGGLSSLAWDARSHSWFAAVDNHATDPSRVWSFRDLSHPTITGDPIVLKSPDGTAYNGVTADNEGMAVLPSGDLLVSSETEPSIRIYDRQGKQKASLPIPARFAVTGTTKLGEATDNATLEGLSLSPDGHTIVAAMEGALSGDLNGTDATAHRFLVYREHGHRWVLTRQIGYRAETGNRIPEVAIYGHDNLLVEEASWTPTGGNQVQLYAVTHFDRARDVSRVKNLGQAPVSMVMAKRLVTNLASCPSLGAPAKETQANPLMDNFEGMAITGRRGDVYGVSLISDDNFSAHQTTRLVNLVVRLPR